jgi:hypothetical protein
LSTSSKAHNALARLLAINKGGEFSLKFILGEGSHCISAASLFGFVSFGEQASFFFSWHFYISLGRSERAVFVFPRSVFIAAAGACEPETKADPHGRRAVRVA